jgi:hypothetical protein
MEAGSICTVLPLRTPRRAWSRAQVYRARYARDRRRHDFRRPCAGAWSNADIGEFWRADFDAFRLMPYGGDSASEVTHSRSARIFGSEPFSGE